VNHAKQARDWEDAPRPPSEPESPAPRPMASRGEQVAAVLKLASALCGLAAAGLFVLPLFRGEMSAGAHDALPAALSQKPGIQEERAAFQGALLVLESQPPGATVRVNGENHGGTPVTVGVDCLPGRTVLVDFSLPGFERMLHSTPCPEEEMITLKARLRKNSGKE
jgi:hypothetical protein